MMTPEVIASRNQALLLIGACVVGALAYAGFWLLTSEHRFAVWVRSVMSSDRDRDTASSAGATSLANDPDRGLQPLALPRNAANDALALGSLGALAANDLLDITPAEARAIIRQQARAEAIVAILRAAEAGKVKSAGDQAGLIEAVGGGARTSRPGTPYTLLKAAVDELRGKPRTEYVGDMIERINAEVAAEH